MKRNPIFISVLSFILVLGILGDLSLRPSQKHALKTIPASPITAQAQVPDLTASKTYTAALDVARVFGRSPGCAEASPELITTVAEEAVKAELDPRILAATVAVESGCNQYATSPKGAIGLTQVVPRIWKGTYDFEHQYNLLNAHDSVRVGAIILGGLIKTYGTASGLRHYNGLGVDCESCDAGYVDRISALAAKR